MKISRYLTNVYRFYIFMTNNKWVINNLSFRVTRRHLLAGKGVPPPVNKHLRVFRKKKSSINLLIVILQRLNHVNCLKILIPYNFDSRGNLRNLNRFNGNKETIVFCDLFVFYAFHGITLEQLSVSKSGIQLHFVIINIYQFS